MSETHHATPRSRRAAIQTPHQRLLLRARLAPLGLFTAAALLLALASWPDREPTRPWRALADRSAPLPVVALDAQAPAPHPLAAEPSSLVELDDTVAYDVAAGRGDAPLGAQLSKLQAKAAAKGDLLAKKQAQLQSLQSQLAAAQAALLAAQSMADDTPAALAAKLLAIAKASQHVAKKLAQLDQLPGDIDLLETQLTQLQISIDGILGTTTGTPTGTPPSEAPATAAVSVPVLLQQVLPAGATGLARKNACATFGLPFAKGLVPQSAGRPALRAEGAAATQFRTLSTWPDGTVQWALADVVADVPAGAANAGVTVVGGNGASDGAPIGSISGNTITLDTGALKATVLRNGFNLFDTVSIGDKQLLVPHQSGGVVGVTEKGLLMLPRPGTLSVKLEENGPARALVRVDGTLASVAGEDVVDFTCRITARAASADLQVDFTVRNASIKRPKETVIRALGLMVAAFPGASPSATLARHDGQAIVPLAANTVATLHQTYSSATTTDVLGSGPGYVPPIAKLDTQTFSQEGYEIVVGSQTLWPLGDKTKYPAHGWVDLSGAKGGVTLSQRQMAYFWPASLQAAGNGMMVAALWPLGATPYTFCWRQHESRTVSFSFHKGPVTSPGDAATRLDWPVTGRAADYSAYDAAGVLPYRLLTEAEETQAYALMGITHTVALKDDALSITRFLPAHNTGGPNNHDSIERRLGGEWLRDGLGGQYLNGLDLSLYKSEWQILRSDDFDDSADPGACNAATVPHSTAFAGDLEHRYRDGMVLAYWLTGDARIRDALFDEAEILATLPNNAQERSFYQTIRALAAVGRFTGSAKLHDGLDAKLDFLDGPTVNVNTATTGFGWEAAPGTGGRRYFVNATQNMDEKPAGENFVSRGFITASLGPVAYFNAAAWLGPQDSRFTTARLRLCDLAYYTRHELFPWFPNAADRHLVYSWAVKLQQVVEMESADFHPILLGMAEAFLQTGDPGYLAKGVEQIQAFAAHDQGPYADNLYLLDSRLDVQHFLAVYRAWKLGETSP